MSTRPLCHGQTPQVYKSSTITETESKVTHLSLSKQAFRIRKVFPKKTLLRKIMRLPLNQMQTITSEVRETLIKEDLQLKKVKIVEHKQPSENLNIYKKKVSIPKISLVPADEDDDEDFVGSSSVNTSSKASSSKPTGSQKRKGFLNPNGGRRRTVIMVEEVDSTVKHSSRMDTNSVLGSVASRRHSFQDQCDAI